jgi:hypothetical protein
MAGLCRVCTMMVQLARIAGSRAQGNNGILVE